MAIKKVPATDANIRELLDNLGSTPDEVYKTLRRKHVKGGRLSSNCPIQQYLSRRIKLKVHPSLHQSLLVQINCVSILSNDDEEITVENPEAVRRFIYYYDNRIRYGDLEESPYQ